MKLEKFDYQIGNKRKKNTFLVLGLVCLGAFITVILYRTFASYKVTNSYNIIGGKVAKFAIDGVTMYLVAEDGTETKTSIIPKENEYVYDATRSQCTNGTEIIYDKANKTISIDETAGDTCNVYFNYIPLAKQTLYALGYTDEDIKTGIPYGPDGTNVTGFYAAEDDYGTSYYYYNNGDNWSPAFIVSDWTYVLVRINGNGSIRMFSYDFNNSSTFNENNNDNMYLGYMYGDLGVSEILNKNNSQAKLTLNVGYEDMDMTYFDDVIFCNDRSLYKEEYGEKEVDDTASGFGTSATYYGAYYRLRNNTPSLKCPNKDDAFTVDDEEIGNGMLDYPVGLMTADEAYMTNAKWYHDWYNENVMTMSPAMFKDNVAYIYHVGSSGIEPTDVTENWDIKQVINIKAGLEFTGDGSDTAPYEIVQ